MRRWIAPLAIAFGSIAVALLRERRAQPLGLQEYDAEQRRYVPVKPPQPSAAEPKAPPLQGWERIEKSSRITLDPAFKYAATIQLTGFEAAFGGVDDVRDKLRSFVDWEALDIWGDARLVSKQFPSAAADESGRFWAIGIPAAHADVEWPEQVVRLWFAKRKTNAT